MAAADGAVVRRAVEGDAEKLFDLASAFATSFAVNAGAFRGQFAEMLGSESCVLLVATIDGEAVGYAAGSMHPTLYANGPVGRIEELMVTAADSRSGVGGLLVAAVGDWPRARGGVMISLATRRAALFWSSIGFEESATYFRRIL